MAKIENAPVSKNWVMVSLSQDKTTLSIERDGAYLEKETAEAMMYFKKILSALSERHSKATDPKERAAVQKHFRNAIVQFEALFR